MTCVGVKRREKYRKKINGLPTGVCEGGRNEQIIVIRTLGEQT